MNTTEPPRNWNQGFLTAHPPSPHCRRSRPGDARGRRVSPRHRRRLLLHKGPRSRRRAPRGDHRPLHVVRPDDDLDHPVVAGPGPRSPMRHGLAAIGQLVQAMGEVASESRLSVSCSGAGRAAGEAAGTGVAGVGAASGPGVAGAGSAVHRLTRAGSGRWRPPGPSRRSVVRRLTTRAAPPGCRRRRSAAGPRRLADWRNAHADQRVPLHGLRHLHVTCGVQQIRSGWARSV